MTAALRRARSPCFRSGARSRRRATRICFRRSPGFPGSYIGIWCTSAAARGSRPCAARAARLGLGARIDWRGALPQDQVLALYRAADLFVLASRIARDGDRDGLPNVLMEAQSQGLACLSTRVSAIPELIEDGGTGVLTPPGDVAALTGALARLIRNPQERARLGAAGADRVRARFAMTAGIDALAARLGPPPPAKAAE